MGVIFSIIFGRGRVKKAALCDSLVSCKDCAVNPEVVEQAGEVEIDIEVPAPAMGGGMLQYSMESIQEESNSAEGRGGGGEAVQAVLEAGAP